MKFEEWIRLAILDGFDPVNENKVATGSRFFITCHSERS